MPRLLAPLMLSLATFVLVACSPASSTRPAAGAPGAAASCSRASGHRPGHRCAQVRAGHAHRQSRPAGHADLHQHRSDAPRLVPRPGRRTAGQDQRRRRSERLRHLHHRPTGHLYVHLLPARPRSWRHEGHDHRAVAPVRPRLPAGAHHHAQLPCDSRSAPSLPRPSLVAVLGLGRLTRTDLAAPLSELEIGLATWAFVLGIFGAQGLISILLEGAELRPGRTAPRLTRLLTWAIVGAGRGAAGACVSA